MKILGWVISIWIAIAILAMMAAVMILSPAIIVIVAVLVIAWAIHDLFVG